MTQALDAAKEILDTVVNHFMLKPGDRQLTDVFLRVWQGRGQDEEAFAPGLEHCVERGWVTVEADGSSFVLTQAGFDEA